MTILLEVIIGDREQLVHSGRYLVQLDALLRDTGFRVLHAEDPQLGLHQVGGVLLHGRHVEGQPSEIRVVVRRGDNICGTTGNTFENMEAVGMCECECYDPPHSSASCLRTSPLYFLTNYTHLCILPFSTHPLFMQILQSL